MSNGHIAGPDMSSKILQKMHLKRATAIQARNKTYGYQTTYI